MNGQRAEALQVSKRCGSTRKTIRDVFGDVLRPLFGGQEMSPRGGLRVLRASIPNDAKNPGDRRSLKRGDGASYINGFINFCFFGIAFLRDVL